MKLAEVYKFNEVGDLENGLNGLERLLKDQNIELVPLIINPPVMPNKSDIEFYKENILPILDRTGWQRMEWNYPVVNKKHWKLSDISRADYGGNMVLAYEDMEAALRYVEPVSDEARALMRYPEMLDKIAAQAQVKIDSIANDLTGFPLMFGIPGKLKLRRNNALDTMVRRK